MYREDRPYGEALITTHLPTVPARRYLNWFSMAGWHRCNRLYRRDYPQGGESVFLLFTVEGMGRLRAGERIVSLPPGSLAIVPPGLPMAYGTDGEGWEFYWLDADGPFVRAAAEQLWLDGLAGPTPRRPALCLRVMRALLEEEGPGKGGLRGELEQSRLLAELFDGLLEELLFPDVGAQAAPSLPEQMAAYLEAHYAEPVRMDALSRRFYLSQNQLIRLFHARTGYTPGDYLKKYRLLKACEWLLTTELPVGEVGRRVGYGNASHFTARFREQYGMTPTAYRRQHAGDKPE